MLRALPNRFSWPDRVRPAFARWIADGVTKPAFSNAALHWVPRSFEAVRGDLPRLKPAGSLVAQCGGGPNILRVRQRARSLMDAEPLDHTSSGGPWEFVEDPPSSASKPPGS
jgi:hypothetical protein